MRVMNRVESLQTSKRGAAVFHVVHAVSVTE